VNPLEPGALRGLSAGWTLANVTVWDGLGGVHEAISFGANGRVAAVGEPAAGLEVVDGHGAFVCPGFVDPHVHVRAAASARLAFDIADATGPEDVLSSVRGACSGEGWTTLVGLQTARRPHRRDLDRVSGPSRVRIRDRTGHAWLLNSAALATVGIDAAGTRESVPAGVHVERGDDRTPTGYVVDHIGWIGERTGRVNDSRRLERAVQAWSRERLRDGVVALCDVTATNDQPAVRALHGWRLSGTLQQEVMLLTAPGVRVEGRAKRRVCGVKFTRADDARLVPALRCGRADARFVAVHCVDPRETGAVLAAATAAGRRRAHLRIEHASFVPPDWLPELARLGATVVTHPSFIVANGDRYLDDPELEPHDWLYRLASWRRANVTVAFGSDAPFGPAGPLDALRAAAARRTAAGVAIGPEEALVGDDALHAVTSAAADCSGLSRFGYGRLAPGRPGCAVVLDADPRRSEALVDARIVATVSGGAVAD
jgi:predicted amidohydrolase YtcJ